MFSFMLAFALATSYQHVGPTPPPHGMPAIKSYTISSTDLHAGQTVSGEVETSENVVNVDAKINYRYVALARTGPGRFTLSYTVPWWLPPWLRHAYTLNIIARSEDGVEAWLGIPIRIH